MNLTKSALLVGVTGLITGTAMAGGSFDFTQEISLGTMSSGAGATFTVDLDNPGEVVGLSWGGDWAGSVSGWPNDWALYATAGDGTPITIPSYSFGAGGTSYAPVADMETSATFFSPIDRSGTWTFQFVDTFGGTAGSWSEVHVTLYKVPAPGAVALLGLAGLAGTRRRRR